MNVEQEPIGWITDDFRTDKSATTYDAAVAERWRKKGWNVEPIFASALMIAPDMLTPSGKHDNQHYYAQGWNDAINEMLRTSKE